MAKSSTSSSQQSIGDMITQGLGNLIKLLPTGTVFLFQFLSPVLTNSGQCSTTNKYLTGVLLVVCGLSCCISSFTDSYKGKDGKTHYGIATKNGLQALSDSDTKSTDLSSSKLQLRDFVHAFFSLIVFGVVALLNKNTVSCYYPSFEANLKKLLMALPPVVGTISSIVFAVLPSKRNGIGYPATSQSTNVS